MLEMSPSLTRPRISLNLTSVQVINMYVMTLNDNEMIEYLEYFNYIDYIFFVFSH